MRDFDFSRAFSIKEAIEASSTSKRPCFFMAGGTDLLVQIEQKKIEPMSVIDINSIDEIRGISLEGEELRIGALTSIRTLETSMLASRHVPLLSAACSKIGSVQIRNRATVGGNLCNASPSADTAPPLLVLDAKAELQGKKGKRLVELTRFFTGPGTTILEDGELLTYIKIPLPRSRRGAVYHKLTPRNAMDLAFVGVAVLLDLDDSGRIVRARVALGAVAPTPVRATASENILLGRTFDREAFTEAARLASSSCNPITDHRASAQYRREMVAALCQRGLEQAYIMAASERS